MTPAQQGVWVVQCALYRGQRHARKQGRRKFISQVWAHMETMDLDDYIARREARGTE